MGSLIRELKFAARDYVILFGTFLITTLSAYSLISGFNESKDELDLIERTKDMVKTDRAYNLAKQSDAGGAAYYAFHFTYDPPSPIAFIARGVRDDLPWKHRIRMLALEGQIYETDTGNPELSLIGKLDFAFVAAFLLPLLIILVLFDLRAVEIRNNRWALLSITAGNGNRLLLKRALIRCAVLFAGLCVPLLLVGLFSNASIIDVFLAILIVFANCLIWCLLSYFVLTRVESGPTTAALLLGAWFVVSIVVPVGGKYAVENSINVPLGGEILLTQREAVNDAWDLPKESTMNPFYERHPKWADSPEIKRPFEWKWYFAFQQVGDQTVEQQSRDLRKGIAERDRTMSTLSALSPALFTQRQLSSLANTDVTAFQNYEACVRGFHKALRDFHYPMLFGNVEYSEKNIASLPEFESCS
ncbi:MAG: DUF3526 domain-containing protein [Acidiferrobacterales bacterium]|nr:DUF3526 domain-containing protein [Acidiferrobacterales bacterium]